MKINFWEWIVLQQKVRKTTPKNRYIIIKPLVRSRFSCVFRYYKGNDRAGINIRDVILVIFDIFDILSAILF